MVIWVMKIFFVQFFCVFLPPLLNIFFFCYVHTISVLYCAHLCMKCGEGTGNPLQYSCLENPMDRGACGATVHGVTKNRTRLSDFTFTLLFFGTLHSDGYIFPFLFCFLLLFFSQLWEIDGETVETVSDFILRGSKITADGDCSHEIKRCLLLGRKVMTILDSILKNRDITLPTKVRLVKAVVFSSGHVSM